MKINKIINNENETSIMNRHDISIKHHHEHHQYQCVIIKIMK